MHVVPVPKILLLDIQACTVVTYSWLVLYVRRGGGL